MSGDRSKEILASSNFRWMSMFLFAAAVLAYFQISEQKPIWFKYGVILLLVIQGLKILFTKPTSKIWIERNQLCFDIVNQKNHQVQKIDIHKIAALKIVFAGARIQQVRHRCYVVTTESEVIELPSDIKYCSYNPNSVHLNFLAKPLRRRNSDIRIEIEDKVEGSKIDFGKKT